MGSNPTASAITIDSIVSYETLASQGLIWHRNQSKHLVVIGPCAYCAAADVKEAAWRVRSQLTVGTVWSIRLSVRTEGFQSSKSGSTPLCSTIVVVGDSLWNLREVSDH